jgi:hypothetical protein
VLVSSRRFVRVCTARDKLRGMCAHSSGRIAIAYETIQGKKVVKIVNSQGEHISLHILP